ncbi:MAG TPA: ABC transporter substrate-binding protein, partial [Clostridia bacterium]|nr:ABC transporter substrate-binding protein [Clostridia bacterium]
WEFSIRRGVYWHGTETEVSAYDVKHTLDRIMNEETIYTPAVKRTVSSYDIIDLYRISITPVEKGMDILYALNFPIVSQTYGATALENGNMPKGTGPYMLDLLDSKDEKKRLTMKVNHSWRKLKPNITSIVAVEVADEAEAMQLFAQGELDVVPLFSQFSGWYKHFGPNRIHSYQVSDYEYIVPNMSRAVMADIAVRKAIAYGIDTRNVISRAYTGYGVSSDLPIIPNSWLNTNKKISYDHNPVLAGELLEGSGWKDTDGDGFVDKNGAKLSFELIVNKNDDDFSRYNAALCIAEDMKSIGIEVIISQLPNEEFMARLASGNFDAALIGSNIGSFPYFEGFFGSPGLEKNGYSFSREAEILNVLKEIRDEEEYKLKVKELQDILLDEMPFIGLYFRTDLLIYSSDLYVVPQMNEGDIYKAINEWFFIKAD